MGLSDDKRAEIRRALVDRGVRFSCDCGRGERYVSERLAGLLASGAEPPEPPVLVCALLACSNCRQIRLYELAALGIAPEPSQS